MSKDRNNKKKTVKQWFSTDALKKVGKVFGAVFAVFKVVAGALATVLLICIVCGFVFMGIMGDYLETDILPNASVVLDDYDMDAPSYIYYVDAKGEIVQLQELYASTDWKKADYEDIPQALIHSAIAIEDKRFYEHQGVDWFTTIKAFANMFFGDETVGGSSITQQLIKNVTGKDSVTVQRKVQEFFSATLVEKNNDKKAIIEEYLNSIYMGQGCRGVRSAAQAYFGKELQTLTIAECASLISITNNPSVFDPYSDSEFMYEGELMNGKQRNRHRQMLVLGELLNQGYITREEYDEAVNQELVLKSTIDDEDKWIECVKEDCGYEGVRSTFSKKDAKCPKCGTKAEIKSDASQEVYSYFVDTLLKDVARDMAKKDNVTEWDQDILEYYLNKINSGGYHIYATIDMNVQNQVDKIYKDLDNIPDTRSAQQLQSAIVVINNKTGDIVAMAGGVGDDKVHFGFNRATQSMLQSGSSIKPLTIYAPGFEQGTITPATVIKDLPISYDDGAWPRNDTRRYSYSRTIFSGLEDSVNAVAANTLKKIGAGYGYEFAKDKFGLSTLVDEDLQFNSLSLGAQEVGITVRDMACAFATFPNNGEYRKGRTYTKVYDRRGNVVLDNEQETREVLGEKAVNYINYTLTNAASAGTGAGADFYSVDVAGKTGTTSSSRDRWFCGYTGYYTAAVWCGYDTPEKINLNFNPASRLWRYVMEPLHEGLDNIRMYDPYKMVSVSVCLDSGKIATDACKADVRGSRVETVLVYPEDVPSGRCDKHVLVDYCSAGNGVANEYCGKFAEKKSDVKISKKALVKLNTSAINEILQAKNYGLYEEFYQNDYVYFVDNNGKDAAFKGFGNTLTGNTEPYKGCKVHTKDAWDSAFGKTEKPEKPNDEDTKPEEGSGANEPTTPQESMPDQTTSPGATADVGTDQPSEETVSTSVSAE